MVRSMLLGDLRSSIILVQSKRRFVRKLECTNSERFYKIFEVIFEERRERTSLNKDTRSSFPKTFFFFFERPSIKNFKIWKE